MNQFTLKVRNFTITVISGYIPNIMQMSDEQHHWRLWGVFKCDLSQNSYLQGVTTNNPVLIINFNPAAYNCQYS